MCYFDFLLYGREHAYLHFADTFLKMLSQNEKDLTTNETFEKLGEKPPFFDAVANELEKDGLIKCVSYGYYITLKGRKKIISGGYRHEKFLKRIGMLVSIIACIAAVVAAIFSAIAAFKE